MPITFIDEEETKSKITFLDGDPKIDMKSANEELAAAQRANTPLQILDKVTGYPYTNPNVIGNNIGQILTSPVRIAQGLINDVTHPKETINSILEQSKKPLDPLLNYIGRYSPKNIKNTLATDPIGVITDAAVLGSITKAGINSIPKKTPDQMVKEAENITQRILNPSRDEIADALLKNSKIPAVREAAKVIRKSPNEKALLNNIDDAIKINFKERNSILEKNNYRMTDNHIKGLEEFINERKSKGQINPHELRQMENVLAEEKAWYVKNKDKFDRIGGQNRKEYLQDVTNTLLERSSDGVKTITQPARKQALDVLRSGIMKEVEGKDLRVRELNSTYAGLKDAREMLANQAAIIEQNINKNMVERLLVMAQSAMNPQAAAINVALKNANNIGRMSAKIEKLMSKATKKSINRVINDSINEEKILGIPDLTPKYLKERKDSSIKSLGTKPKFIKNKPYQIGGIGDLKDNQL